MFLSVLRNQIQLSCLRVEILKEIWRDAKSSAAFTSASATAPACFSVFDRRLSHVIARSGCLIRKNFQVVVDLIEIFLFEQP